MSCFLFLVFFFFSARIIVWFFFNMNIFHLLSTKLFNAKNDVLTIVVICIEFAFASKAQTMEEQSLIPF